MSDNDRGDWMGGMDDPTVSEMSLRPSMSVPIAGTVHR